MRTAIVHVALGFAGPAILALLAASTSSGCTSSGEEPAGYARQASTVDGGVDAGTPACPSDAATCVEVAAPVEEDAACPKDRWIAYIDPWPGTCPATFQGQGGTWTGESLFLGVGTGPWPLAPGLRPFCLYTWEPASGAKPPPPPDLAQLHEVLDARATSLDPDCQVVVASAPSLAEQEAWQDLRADFHAQVGALSALPVDPASPPRKVRVGVVDSVPTSYTPSAGNTGDSPHGWAVGRLIRELGCPAPGDPTSACISTAVPHLALILDPNGAEDPVDGGHFGRISDVAVAVVDAVNAWRLHNHGRASSAPSYQPRLVVNLSVGWEPRWGGRYPGNWHESLDAPSRAVHAAITHIKCWGGVAVAAAGNAPGGPEKISGPMLPALWETKPAPSAQDCAQFEGAGYDSGAPFLLLPTVSVYDPLVHAVGGVRADDQPLALTRPGGRPRLTAPAAHAVAADTSSETLAPTAVLTGTSMGAAVVSAIASVVWGYHPDLTGPEMMALLHDSAVDLSVPADFCLDGRPCPLEPDDPERAIKRVHLCQAVLAACPDGTHCPPDPLPCVDRPAYSGSMPAPAASVIEAIENAAVASASALSHDQSLPALPVCEHAGFQSGDATMYSPDTCPYRQWGARVREPWTGPQPGSYPCPTCFLSLTSDGDTGYRGTLYLSVDPDYQHELLPGTLVIDGYGEIDLSALGRIVPGTEAVLSDIVIKASGPFGNASVALRDADGSVSLDSATSSELIVYYEH